MRYKENGFSTDCTFVTTSFNVFQYSRLKFKKKKKTEFS